MKTNTEFQAIVLAAGRGSRMPEITYDKPKCLLPIGNKPMIWYPLFKLQQSGFSDALVIVNDHQKQDIQLALENQLHLKIDYFPIENKDEKGPLDALRLLQDKIKKDVIIISCDLITDINLGEVINTFRKKGASVCSLMFYNIDNEKMDLPGPKTKYKPERDLIGIDSETQRYVFTSSSSDFENEFILPKATLSKHKQVTIHSNFFDSHLYVMKSDTFSYMVKDTKCSSIKGELIPHLLRKQLLQNKNKCETDKSIVSDKSIDFETANSYNDHSGDIEPSYHGDLMKCYTFVAKPETLGIRVNNLYLYWLANKKIFEKYLTNESEMLDKTATIKSTQINKTFVWSSSTIEEKTSLSNSIVGTLSKVGSCSRIVNTILMNNVAVNTGVILENCIVCDGATIESGCQLKGCIIGTKYTVKKGSNFTNEILSNHEKLMEL